MPSPSRVRSSRTGLSPEHAVLMATVRDDDDEALARSLAREGLSWGLLLVLAEEEKASPVLHRRVAALRREGAPVPAPEEALGALERLAWVQQFRLLEFERRLRRLLEAYRQEGIEAVLLKGAALRFSVFDSLLDRPMGDIDLLVRPDRAEAARDVARALGWGRSRHANPDEWYAGHHHLPPLGDDAGLDFELEIHTELFRRGNPFSLSAETILGGARRVCTELDARVPSPEHLLLHAALHFTWSNRFRLGAWRTFRDVDALLDRGGLDWDRFIREARESRAGSAAYWTLYLARKWAGASVDDRLLKVLAPRGFRLLDPFLARHFALELVGLPHNRAPGWLRDPCWNAAMRPVSEGHGSARPWLLGKPASNQGAVDSHDPEARPPSRFRRVARKGLRTGRHLAGMLAGA